MKHTITIFALACLLLGHHAIAQEVPAELVTVTPPGAPRERRRCSILRPELSLFRPSIQTKLVR